jgi:raffinose/stachyose/melibiose transport system substrate-binding protein
LGARVRRADRAGVELKGGTVNRRRLLAAAAVVAMVAAACSSDGDSNPSASGASAAPVTITIWHNYGTEQNATALQGLADAFHALHPNITMDVVSQPADNYFALLQAAAVSKTGPDLGVMWTGLFTLKYKSFLANLKGLVPDASLARIDPTALQWTADGFDAANGPYVMPLEEQFYIGFYNKAAFQKAGVTAVPTDWNELFAACEKLKAAGYMPMTYGNGGQPLGAEFYPWYDMSYMMIGSYSVEQWKGLYDGTTPWTDPTITGQLSNWAKLKSSGCTNTDVLTKTNNLGDFTSGKAAMIIDGTWDTQKYTDALGSDVAAFVPPFSDTPIKGVVAFAGDGLAMTSYSSHQAEAAQFLDFMTTDQAAQIIDDAGLIPAIQGSSTSNPVNQQMLDFVEQDGMIPYPMLDNVVQGEVVDTGNKVLPSILDGSSTPDQGMQDMLTAWNQVPEARRGSTYA